MSRALPSRVLEGRLVTPLLNAREVAELLQLSERKVYDLARSGVLPAKRYGGQWRFELDRVLAAGDPEPEQEES